MLTCQIFKIIIYAFKSRRGKVVETDVAIRFVTIYPQIGKS